MDKQARRAAIAAYKERKAAWGVFAVRCAASGAAWVGASRNLEGAQNGLWFTLRHGGGPHRGLHAAWVRHGEAAFSFEILERLPDDLSEVGRADQLKARRTAWAQSLAAEPLL